ncbi:RNA polymerase sigma factor [Labilibaculum sp.]|uniref:RNA polymerase sigma factor n=1 Tax=Labilibaculum sp. TaxID=2060723 RepID=UPI0035696203
MTAIEFKTNIVSLNPQLKLYALRLTANQEDAMDLCQDTLLKAITYSANFTHSNLKAWTFTIMKNIFINAYRRKLKQREWILHETKNQNAIANSRGDNPISLHTYNEIVEEFNKLHTSMREPFKMYLDGFKYREIAEHLDLPIGTIKSRIFQARKFLMSNLREFAQH